MALVREGIQNSLDQRSGDDPVIVRIFISGKKNAVPFSKVKYFFANAWEHYHAEGNGLIHHEIPKQEDSCDYILFEDFSTTGLEGDAQVPFKPRDGGKNNFYHFFRAEGQTDKMESELGSWGVGKHVLYRASKISTIFGLSVRASDKKRLLMGNAILKSHYDSKDQYCQDGTFGIPPSSDSELVMPITDNETLDIFTKTFDLMRNSDEPGLSVVIPWPDEEINEKAVIKSVLNDYFYPILSDQLSVFVEAPGIKTVLDSDNLIKEIKKIDSEITNELLPLVKLAAWARNVNDDERFLINKPDPNEAWKWWEILFNDDLLQKTKERYYHGDKIAFRVPVTVRKRNNIGLDSYFDVYLERENSDHSGRPTFIREGIIIPKVDAPRTRGVRSLVIAHDEPIAKFLRKSENPSHTEWQHSHLKEEYKIGYKTCLDFVKNSVHEIVRIISETEEEEDPTLLIDFFSLPEKILENDTYESEGDSDDGDIEKPETPIPTPTPSNSKRRFNIKKIDGGFSILPSKNDRPPKYLEVKVAYDTRRGHPLNKYTTSDFKIDESPIRQYPKSKNINVIALRENTILLEVLDEEYSFHLTGFDQNRQLYVKALTRGDITNGS